MRDEYTVNVFGFKAKGSSPAIFLLLPIGIIFAYLAGCLALYSFVELIGILEFTWLNGFYTIVLIITLNLIFTNGG